MTKKNYVFDNYHVKRQYRTHLASQVETSQGFKKIFRRIMSTKNNFYFRNILSQYFKLTQNVQTELYSELCNNLCLNHHLWSVPSVCVISWLSSGSDVWTFSNFCFRAMISKFQKNVIAFQLPTARQRWTIPHKIYVGTNQILCHKVQ